MTKTVFFNIPAQGHINPSLPVTAELVRRGEQVIYVNAEEIRSLAETTGAVFRPYPAMPELIALVQNSAGNIPRNALALVEIGERLLPFIFDLLRAEQPDYVIFDSLAGWGKQAADVLGIPALASIVTFVLIPGDRMPIPTTLALRTIGQFLPVIPRYMRTARRIRRNLGVKNIGLLGAVMNTGEMNIIYTSRDFQPGASRFDERFQFVGPSISPRPDDSGFPFEQITRQPVIYISLGTIHNDNLDFYRQCFAAFADHPGQFILSAGKRTDLQVLGDIPANFIVRNFVPQLEVLERTDVFITHGGMNSVSEGLWYGVPLVAIPHQVEQAVVAHEVEKQGAGLALGMQPPFGHVTASELRAAVDRILADRTPYQQAAVRLGDSFRAAGGYARAADAILAFAQSHPRVKS
ncbi:MAG: macrolide family glycosyltransferase [Chloroflexota bacterium]